MSLPFEDSARASQGEQPRSLKTRRADRERVRVSRACDRCKGKKIKCSGKRPCALCGRLGLPCLFNAQYTRGKLPHIEDENSSLSPTNDRQMHLTDNTIREPATPVSNGLQDSLLAPDPESAAQSSRNSPEPSQTDRQGHYVGPSSAVSFLLRAQKRLHKIVSLSQNSSIFTFGDSPLPEFDSSFFILLPIAEARALVARYFDFAVPTHRYLHQATVETWLEELYADPADSKHIDRGKRAVTFMVFAQASEYIPKANGVPDSGTSARYFQAAEHQLRGETGEIRLTSVQARLLQCFWLLSESRINHCWSLFGTTGHLILALGLHRKRRRNKSGSYDLIDAECRKRVFWSAYTLDIYLSAALGRPRTFHDDDIDQELPSLLDDSQLSSNAVTSISKAQSVMLGPLSHAKLAQVISGVLKDLYGIRPVKPEHRLSLARKHTEELRRWRQGISHFLDIDSSLLSPLFQRQNTVLRLAYDHAMILVHRPFLLSNFAELTRQNKNPALDNQESVQECLKAAMSIVSIVDDLCERGQNYPTFWFTHYYSFCAVVVLYVYTIQSRSLRPSRYRHFFEAAQKCQRQISSLKAVKDSFAQRYSIVLEELRLEALNQTSSSSSSTISQEIPITSPPAPPTRLLSSQHGNPNNHTTTTVTDLEGDNTEEVVARSILRLSGRHHNEHLDDNMNSHSSSRPFECHAPVHSNIITHLNVPFNTNNSNTTLQQPTFPPPPPQDPFSFTTTTPSPSSIIGEAVTGWEEFDSFVTAGIGMGSESFLDGSHNLFFDDGSLTQDMSCNPTTTEPVQQQQQQWDFPTTATNGLIG